MGGGLSKYMTNCAGKPEYYQQHYATLPTTLGPPDFDPGPFYKSELLYNIMQYLPPRVLEL